MISLQRFAGMNCHYIRHSRDHFFASMEALGYERIELWAASPHYFAPHFSEAMVRALKADMARHGLSLVCLTPEQVTYPVNIASGEAYLRELSIDLHKKTLEHAALLESPLMLLTPGYGNLDEPREEAWKRSADSCAQLARYAEKLGVTIALEHLSPISSNLINTAADLRAMLDAVHSPRFKCMFDMGQVHIVGEKPETYFELLGEDIVHIHFVDGTPGGHLALGDGTLDLTGALACIERAGYTGNLSLEIADRRYFMDPRAADEQSLRWLKTNQKGDGTR